MIMQILVKTIFQRIHLLLTISAFSVCILVLLCSIAINSVDISSDFLLDIDGSSIITSHEHACVISYKHGVDIGGKVVCWSGNDDHEFNPPEDLIFIQLSGSMSSDCGITIDQTLHCWRGPVGMKMQLPGLYTQVTCNGNYCCGILTDGRIRCFGNSIVPSYIPEEDGNKYVQISCSASHCCALDDKAFPHCFGYEDYKAIITPTMEVSMSSSGEIEEQEDEDEEADISGSASSSGQNTKVESIEKMKFRQISVGEHYSCGITLDGNHLRCWGENNLKLKKYPRYVEGPFKQVSLGNNGICVLTAAAETVTVETESNFIPHALRCWGMVTLFIPLPDEREWDQISVGHSVICGVTMDSEVHCWGNRRINSIPPNLIVA